jgi:hypothetical protein
VVAGGKKQRRVGACPPVKRPIAARKLKKRLPYAVGGRDLTGNKGLPMTPDDAAFISLAMEKMEKERGDAEARVKSLPCSRGGTVQEFLDKQVSNPAVTDQGWFTKAGDGGFEVERRLILLGKKTIRYRWQLAADGKIRAANAKALSITNE